MAKLLPAVGQYVFLPRSGLDELISILRQGGWTVIGPTLKRGVVGLGQIESAEQLAQGVRDEHERGSYRLSNSDSELRFEYVVGADSPKRYVFPPSLLLFRLHVQDGQLEFDAGPPEPPKLAMMCIRPCDIAALQVLDLAFGTPVRCESDHYYARARKSMVIIALNCTRPGANCFCASMGTGPAARGAFDLALTELREGFLMKIGSAQGVHLAEKLDVRDPTGAELELAELRLEQAREHMGRELDTQGLAEVLKESVSHPRWNEVAKRCLACGNCTMVCPTCLCSSVTDGNELSGGRFFRSRLWDSCFTHQFSYTTAGPVRASVGARYRHWLRHKLCTFQDQYGCTGCVGCGRCITWCPAGIDITEEAAAIRSTMARPQFVEEREVVA